MRAGSLRRRILLPFVVVQLLLMAALVLIVAAEQQRTLAHDLENGSLMTELFFASVVDDGRGELITISERILQSRKLVEALRAGNAQAVEAAVMPVYSRLARYGFTALVLTDPSRRVVARLHEPNRRGDVAGDAATVKAAESRSAVAGIAIGDRGLPVFTAVAPVRDGAEIVGYGAFEQDPGFILRDIRKLVNVELAVLAEKSAVPAADGARLEAMASLEWSRYGSFFFTTPLEKGYREIFDRFLAQHGSELRDAAVVKGGERWHLGFIPLQDLTGKRIGSLVAFRNVTAQTSEHRRHLALVCGLILFSGLYLFIVLSVAIARAEQEMASHPATARSAP